ncbi:MAG: flagellar hook-length control protein FliK [Vulcanimicrobiota bacterium]
MESLSPALGLPISAPSAPSAPSACDGITSSAVKRGTDKSDEFSSVLSKKLESVKKEAESDTDDEILSMLTASVLGASQQKTENVEPPEVEAANLTQDAVEAMRSAGQDGAQLPAFPMEFIPAAPLTMSALQPSSAAPLTMSTLQPSSAAPLTMSTLQPSSADPTKSPMTESVPLPDVLNSKASSSMTPAVNDSQIILQALDDMARELLSSEPGTKEADNRFNQMMAEALQKEAAVSSDAPAATAKSSPVLPSIVKAIEYKPQEGRELSSSLLQKLDEAVSRMAVVNGRGDIRESHQARPAASALSVTVAPAAAGDSAESLLLAESVSASGGEQLSAEGNELLSTHRLNGESIAGDREIGESLFRPLHENMTRELTGNIKENRALQEPNLRVQISDLIRQVSGAMESSKPGELINVKLDPPTLGEVSVRVVVENSRMNVQFSVSDRSVKSLIEENLDTLVQQCADKGIALGGFSVECRQGRNFQDYTPSKNTKGFDDEVEEMESFKSVLPEYMSNRVNVRV